MEWEQLNGFWLRYNNLLIDAGKFGFTTANILGEYTEQLCAHKLSLKLQSNNQAGYDALDQSGARVQIKGRRILRGDSAKLTTLWNLDFDYIVAVIYRANGEIHFAQRISVAAIERDVPFVKAKNCWRVVAKKSNAGIEGYQDITSQLL